jgi:hypothetical protein
MGKYWGYKHTSGTVHLKRAFGNFIQDTIDDAESSPFVEKIVYPFDADSRSEASEVLKAKLND